MTKESEFLSCGVADTEALAARIAEGLRGGEVIVLAGELGAGKTAFTKGLAKALGVSEPVVSPTFTMVKEYRGRSLKLFHFDLYRIEDAEELYELGLDEYFADDAVTVIEWNKLDFDDFDGKIIEISIDYVSPERRLFRISERLNGK